MKEQYLVKGGEFCHLEVTVMRAKNQGPVPEADPEVGQEADPDQKAGQGLVQDLEAGLDLDQDQSQDQEVGQQGQGQVRGQGLVVLQGPDLVVLPGQGQEVQQDLGLEVQQGHRSQGLDLPLDHQQGQTNLEVKGHQQQDLVVKPRTDCQCCR